MDITNTKEMLKFVFALMNGLDKAYADDKKIDFMDVQYLVGALYALPDAIANLDQVPAELKDMDAAEQKELFDYMKAEFDIADDELEGKIEMGLKLGFDILSFYNKVK